MAATPITTEELRKSMRKSMSQRANFGSRGGGGSMRGSWASASIREVIGGPGGDVFQKSGRENDDDEEELKWAAIERLPTYDRMRKGIITQIMDDGRVVREEVDLSNLDFQNKKHLMQSILKVIEDDNERFLTRLRDRTDRLETKNYIYISSYKITTHNECQTFEVVIFLYHLRIIHFFLTMKINNTTQGWNRHTES